MRFEKFLTSSKTRVFFTSLILLAIIAFTDYNSDLEISFSLFYLVPIIVAAWYGTLKIAVFFSLLGSTLWMLNYYWLIAFSSLSLIIPLWNSLLELILFIVFAFSISKLRAYIDKINSISELKSDMVHVVSHEFNNALTNISISVSLLKESEPEPKTESRDKLYSTLNETVKALILYVKNILNAAKMEKGKLKLHKVPLFANDLINEALLLVDNSIKVKKIDLLLEIKDKTVKIMADREAILIVMSNLIGNAVKYTQKNGKIKITLAPRDTSKKVLFKIDDTGIGIPKSDMSKIKTGFYRTETGRALAEGFGLGIKISNEMLVLHGSSLTIRSAHGKGTSMSFLIDAA